MNREVREHAQRLLLNAMLARGLPEQVWAVDQEEFATRVVANEEERLASIVHTPFGSVTADSHEGSETIESIVAVQVRAESTEALDALTAEVGNQVARTYGFEVEEEDGGRNVDLRFYWTELTLRISGDVVSVPEYRVEDTTITWGPSADPVRLTWGPDSDPIEIQW